MSNIGDNDESIYWPASGVMQVLEVSRSRQPLIACLVLDLQKSGHLHCAQLMIQHLQKIVHLHSAQLMVQRNQLHESFALCQKCLCILHVPQKLCHLCFGEGRKPAPTTNSCSCLLGLHHILLTWNQAEPKQLANLLSNRDTKGKSDLQCHMYHISQDVSHQLSKPVNLETAMLLEQELPTPAPPPRRQEKGPQAADLKACDGMISLASMLRQPAYPLEVKCPCNASTTM